MTKPKIESETVFISASRRCAFFEGLSQAEIGAMLDAATFIRCPTSGWLYHQGEPAHLLFLLQSGLVRLSQVTAEGEELLVRLVKPGELFGYFVLRPGSVNVASAQVVQASELAVWDRHAVIHLLRSNPSAALNLLSILVGLANEFHNRTRRLQTQPAPARVAGALAELIRRIGVPSRCGVVLEQGIGHRDLAELAGTTIFTVSRALANLEREGVLKKQRGRIVVLQPEKLSQ